MCIRDSLGLDDPVLDLVGHAQAVPAADDVGLVHEGDGIVELAPVDRHGTCLLYTSRCV